MRESLSIWIWLPTVVMFVAVYALLPQVRRSWQAWQAVGLAGAFVAAGLCLMHGTGIWPETLLFYSFATVAIIGGVLLVTQSNPVYAALSFALVVVSTCGLFLLNGAPFLSAATIIVYAGAIIVTFLFVIMLAQQSGVDDADLRSREPFLASVAGFVLLGSLLGVVHRTLDQDELNELTSGLQSLAEVKTTEELNKRYGKAEIGKMQIPLTEKLRRYLPDSSDDSRNYAAHIEQARSQGKLEVLRQQAERARKELETFRAGYGTVAPRGSIGKLPAENVAGLGAVLFTDYLVPVELAGVLLLVATIGAIAIAGRRGEVLR
jgi:NADH:ubiquinone oxidoreductase subunit 6 (subunit J)